MHNYSKLFLDLFKATAKLEPKSRLKVNQNNNKPIKVLFLKCHNT